MYSLCEMDRREEEAGYVEVVASDAPAPAERYEARHLRPLAATAAASRRADNEPLHSRPTHIPNHLDARLYLFLFALRVSEDLGGGRCCAAPAPRRN